MSDDVYRLTEEGKTTVLGIISSLCHDFSLEQSAMLNGLDSAGEARIMLAMLCVEAGLMEPFENLDSD